MHSESEPPLLSGSVGGAPARCVPALGHGEGRLPAQAQGRGPTALDTLCLQEALLLAEQRDAVLRQVARLAGESHSRGIQFNSVEFLKNYSKRKKNTNYRSVSLAAWKIRLMFPYTQTFVVL